MFCDEHEIITALQLFIIPLCTILFHHKIGFPNYMLLPNNCSGPGSSSGKALGYVLDDPGSIPGAEGVEIFLHSFLSRLVLGSTQPNIK